MSGLMRFSIWVRTAVAENRGDRMRQMHLMLEAIGPLFPTELQEKLARAGARVTIDTVQRDLKLLEEKGYVQKTGHRYWRDGWRYTLPTDSL